MKKVNNMETLEIQLRNESESWQKQVFTTLGVIVLPGGKNQYNWTLVSSCGYADLADDVDDYSGEGIVISTVQDLITYIGSMPTYLYALKNIQLGSFSKADLFWAVYTRILCLNVYDSASQDFVYGLRAIFGPNTENLWWNIDDELWFDASYCGVDTLNDVYVPLKTEDSLQTVVDAVAKHIQSCREAWDDDDVPPFSYNPAAAYAIPLTFEEVLSAYHSAMHY